MRCAVILVVAGGGIAPGQTLPATAATTAPAASTLPAAAARSSVDLNIESGRAANVRHDAVVHAVGGRVEVVADGSSLNQTLREIGRVTGMKITGNVADEPVYGRYGPAPANEILSALLDGTGCNMLLREATAAGPGELILTPRTGGVTPPDPNASSPSVGNAEPNVPGSRNYMRPREPWMDSTPRSLPNGGAQTGDSSGQSGGTGNPPNPQQIYQQLQRMQQTQPATPETQQKPQQ